MNLSNLTKEKKQYLVFGLIGAVAILATIGVGVNFSLSSLAASKNELAELTDKIDRAERTLSGSDRIRDGLEESIIQLKSYFNFVPPQQNYYAWATENVYFKGRRAGLEIDTVDELHVSGGKNALLKDPVYFETYSLRITARGGYAQIKAFLRDIEVNHPLVRVSGLEVSKSNDPERHDMQLFIQWPFKLNRIVELWESQPMLKKPRVAAAKPAVASIKPAAPIVVQTESGQTPTLSVSKPTPAVKKPEPVVVELHPASVAKPLEVNPSESSMATVDPLEEKAEILKEEKEMSVLLAARGSRGSNNLESEPVRFVSNSKSTKIQEEILTKDKPKASVSLGSFLDGLAEDINDKH